jgi:hypothetical protein
LSFLFSSPVWINLANFALCLASIVSIATMCCQSYGPTIQNKVSYNFLEFVRLIQLLHVTCLLLLYITCMESYNRMSQFFLPACPFYIKKCTCIRKCRHVQLWSFILTNQLGVNFAYLFLYNYIWHIFYTDNKSVVIS